MIFMRIISMLINEAVEAKRLGIANDEDIETAMQKGVNYPKGLLNWGKEMAIQKFRKSYKISTKNTKKNDRQSPLLRKLN
jgi:3-hydroxybutyryl-CoA dehydrogenase